MISLSWGLAMKSTFVITFLLLEAGGNHSKCKLFEEEINMKNDIQTWEDIDDHVNFMTLRQKLINHI